LHPKQASQDQENLEPGIEANYMTPEEEGEEWYWVWA
jgi:hypothetical protein